MADVDVEAEGHEAPKPARARASKAKGGGGVVAAVGWVIALAAIIVSVFLFSQVQALNSKLSSADIPQPAGAPAGNGQGASSAQGYDAYDWQDHPQEVHYELGELQANTADGKLLVGTVTLLLESGPTTAERMDYEQRMAIYELELDDYFEQMKAYNEAKKKQMSSRAPGGQGTGLVLDSPPLVLAGFAVHTAPAAPLEPPPMPAKPTPPRTVLEKVLDGQATALRSNIVDLINARNGDELTTVEGKDEFKQALVDMINNEMIEAHHGKVKDAFLYPWLVVRGA